MPINFPSSPANNQTYSYGGQSWYWANNVGVWQSSTGPTFTTSDTAPAGPASGDLWWNSNLGTLFIYYNDGDTSQWVTAVPSPAVSGPSVFSITGFYAGLNTPTTGTQRRYFPQNSTLSRLTAWVSQTANSALTLTVNKNGSAVANVTVANNTYIANTIFSSSLLADSDYITIDITSGSGTDIGVRVDYTVP